nr:FAD-binding domain-containing protein [Pseudaestuariivita rosea]
MEKLNDFLPKAGRDYAAKRNYDLGDQGHPHVSGLSPYLRHRLVTEEEVLQAILGRFSLSTAEKFVQEVYWRTYWKGWLELRPQVWRDYQMGLQAALNRVQTESGLRRDWEAACRGETGIDCFDHWAQELRRTGYLHNHARMWFASIWIFTLRLPWELGADFFLRHLLDGDPASNTLGWRWVGGLQTIGKTYLARADNIERYTEGRFRPQGLAQQAAPLPDAPHPPRMAAPEPAAWQMTDRTGVLLTEEDLSPGYLLNGQKRPKATAVLLSVQGRSPLTVSDGVTAFARGAIDDAVARYGDKLGDVRFLAAGSDVAVWAAENGLDQIVTPYAPVGPAADAVAQLEADLTSKQIALIRALRNYDAHCWPHATHGFFKFKEKIPKFLADLKGIRAA